MDCQGPGTGAILYCLPGHQLGVGSETEQLDSNQHSNMGLVLQVHQAQSSTLQPPYKRNLSIHGL